jgi:hypothetical protein
VAAYDELASVSGCLEGAGQGLNRTIKANDTYLYDLDNHLGHAQMLVNAAWDHVKLAMNHINDVQSGGRGFCRTK